MSDLDFGRAEYVASEPPPVASMVEVAPEDTQNAFMQALAYGAMGAVLGSVIYAIVGMWIRIGFIAILVGAIVGTSMMNGSGGVGGRRYQIASVLLTYFSVSSASILQYFYDAIHKGQDPFAHGIGTAIFLFIYFLFGPLLDLIGNVGHGLFGLLLLFFALQTAWKTTQGGKNYLHFRRYNPGSPLGLRD